MDPKHRDRVAFVRLASGHFDARHEAASMCASKKPMAVTNPVLFLAADRELAEEAWAGDIIGIPNHGQLRIGDALTEGESAALHRHPLLRAGTAARRARGRPDEGQASGKGADAIRRGRRRQGVQADDRLGLHRGRRGRAAIRRAGQPDRAGIPAARAVRRLATSPRPAGSPAPRPRSRSSSTSTRAISPPTIDGDIVFLTRLQWDIDRIERDYPELKLTATKEMMV